MRLTFLIKKKYINILYILYGKFNNIYAKVVERYLYWDDSFGIN